MPSKREGSVVDSALQKASRLPWLNGVGRLGKSGLRPEVLRKNGKYVGFSRENAYVADTCGRNGNLLSRQSGLVRHLVKVGGPALRGLKASYSFLSEMAVTENIEELKAGRTD